MTPPDPNPTAPPTVAPATDAAIEALRDATIAYRNAPGNTPLDNLVWGLSACIARIEADRAENAKLRARVAELKEVLKAAIGHCDCLDYNGKALIPCTEANPCAGCYMAAQIRAALKPEPGR